MALVKLFCTFLALLISCEIGTCTTINHDEPTCTSKYDYDYKMLKQMVTLENEMVEIRKLLKVFKDDIHDTIMAVQLTSKTVEDANAKIGRIESSMPLEGSGSTYTRWGKTSCPGNGTELVYKGYTGGSHHTSTGGASNYLCLTDEPTWNVYDDMEEGGATVWGSEYQLLNSETEKFFGNKLYDHDAPCCVCQTKRTSVLMIPGRDTCFDGWTLEYRGYLSAGHDNHHATEFVCLDEQAETIVGGAANLDGKLFYFAEARCGSLKCPPYVQGRELTCVVCSK